VQPSPEIEQTTAQYFPLRLISIITAALFSFTRPQQTANNNKKSQQLARRTREKMAKKESFEIEVEASTCIYGIYIK